MRRKLRGTNIRGPIKEMLAKRNGSGTRRERVNAALGVGLLTVPEIARADRDSNRTAYREHAAKNKAMDQEASGQGPVSGPLHERSL